MGKGLFIEEDREAPADERKGADAADFQSCESFGIPMGSHAQLLQAKCVGQGLEVDVGIGGQHEQERPSPGRIPLDDERLVNQLSGEADRSSDCRGGADGVIEGEELVGDALLFEQPDGQRPGGWGRFRAHNSVE